MLNRFFPIVVFMLFAGPLGASDAALTQTHSQMAQALPYAHLSASIYDCGDSCGQVKTLNQTWHPKLDSRDWVASIEGQPSEPMGFRAVAFATDTGKMAIVFEGSSCLWCIGDWLTNDGELKGAFGDGVTNLSLLLPTWETPQLIWATAFADAAINQHCGGNDAADYPSCASQIVVSGHSLGGALAQWVAIEKGLPAHVFNSAGLSAHRSADNVAIQHYVSRGNRVSDVVTVWGTQYAQTTIDVQIDVPAYLIEPTSRIGYVHSISNLIDAITRTLAIHAPYLLNPDPFPNVSPTTSIWSPNEKWVLLTFDGGDSARLFVVRPEWNMWAQELAGGPDKPFFPDGLRWIDPNSFELPFLPCSALRLDGASCSDVLRAHGPPLAIFTWDNQGSFKIAELQISRASQGLCKPVSDDQRDSTTSISRSTAATASPMPLETGQGLLTGRVLDNFGRPVKGAYVSIVDTTLSATTDADGKFQLPYIPGQLRVSVEAPQHTPFQYPLSLMSATTVPLEDVWLIREPSGEGMFQLSGTGWNRPSECHVIQTKIDDLSLMTSQENTFAALGNPCFSVSESNPQIFFDTLESVGSLSLYKMAADGTILRRQREGGLLGLLSLSEGDEGVGRQKLEYGRFLGRAGRDPYGPEIYLADLEPGTYVFASTVQNISGARFPRVGGRCYILEVVTSDVAASRAVAAEERANALEAAANTVEVLLAGISFESPSGGDALISMKPDLSLEQRSHIGEKFRLMSTEAASHGLWKVAADWALKGSEIDNVGWNRQRELRTVERFYSGLEKGMSPGFAEGPQPLDWLRQENRSPHLGLRLLPEYRQFAEINARTWVNRALSRKFKDLGPNREGVRLWSTNVDKKTAGEFAWSGTSGRHPVDIAIDTINDAIKAGAAREMFIDDQESLAQLQTNGSEYLGESIVEKYRLVVANERADGEITKIIPIDGGECFFAATKKGKARKWCGGGGSREQEVAVNGDVVGIDHERGAVFVVRRTDAVMLHDFLVWRLETGSVNMPFQWHLQGDGRPVAAVITNEGVVVTRHGYPTQSYLNAWIGEGDALRSGEWKRIFDNRPSRLGASSERQYCWIGRTNEGDLTVLETSGVVSEFGNVAALADWQPAFSFSLDTTIRPDECAWAEISYSATGDRVVANAGSRIMFVERRTGQILAQLPSAYIDPRVVAIHWDENTATVLGTIGKEIRRGETERRLVAFSFVDEHEVPFVPAAGPVSFVGSRNLEGLNAPPIQLVWDGASNRIWMALADGSVSVLGPEARELARNVGVGTTLPASYLHSERSVTTRPGVGPPEEGNALGTEGLNALAANRISEGDYIGALEAYRKSLELEPNPSIEDRVRRLEALLRSRGIPH